MESILFNLFWALIAGIALVCFVALGEAIDSLSNNKFGDFIIKMFKR